MHRYARRTAVAVVALVAAGLAVLALGADRRSIGPLEAEVSLVPGLRGGTTVAVPPLGRLDLATHEGPLHVRARVTEVDLARARALLTGEDPARRIAVQVQADVQSALGAVAARTALVALAASGVACAVVFRRRRDVLLGTASVTTALVVGAVAAGLTFDERSLEEPRFSGLLAQAPALIGDVRDFDAYGERVATLAANVTRVYGSLSTLPDSPPDAESTRVLWVSDVHLNPAAYEVMRRLAEQFEVSAIVDTGDSVDLGTELENRLAAPLGTFDVPYVWIRGNHDSRAVTQRYVASLPGVEVLDDGRVLEVAGIRFAGIGDPRFTPDKSVQRSRDEDRALLVEAGERLRRALDEQAEPVDVALVHEPPMADPLLGEVPLVLSGHTHERAARVEEGTLALVQGSSGGAGLRAFDTGEALPLQMSVLHFDADGALLAVDDISVGGVGQRSVTLERRSPESYGVVGG